MNQILKFKAMKTRTFYAVAMTLFFLLCINGAQAQQRETAAIISIDVNGLDHKKEMVTEMVRLELEKLDTFELMDKYDIQENMEKLDIKADNCYGKSKLIKVGQELGVDKIITGNADRYGEKIIFTLKLIDIQSGSIVKTDVMEYINQQEQVQIMARISIYNLMGKKNEQYVVDLLAYMDQPITSPKTTLELNGPRVGFFVNTGERAKKLKAPYDEGGFEMYSVSSMIGYQKEFQYLSSGNFQALIEVVGALNGMEAGKFIPSLSFLNGFRFSNTGLEIGIGPVIRGVKTAKGYYDNEGVWHLEEDMPEGKDYNLVRELDSRGDFSLSTGLILAGGFTIRKGYLNVPLNIYASPNRDGWIYGFTCGFNVAKRPKL